MALNKSEKPLTFSSRRHGSVLIVIESDPVPEKSILEFVEKVLPDWKLFEKHEVGSHNHFLKENLWIFIKR